MNNKTTDNSLKGIAIIGMAGRFPKAKSVEKFWDNLCQEKECISWFSNQELAATGLDEVTLNNKSYVKAGAVLEDVEMFDARFFDLSPREAEIMDPQHRIFLECASEALENAGYNPEIYKGWIGVYAGGNSSTYLHNLTSKVDLVKSLGLQLGLATDKDYIPTRTSYKLNLKGPSINISTACSTSLVGVHVACRGLLNYECDIALAGGVSVQVPHQAGYFYQQEGISSPDGHTRAFDAKGKGTILGSGAGIVVLKRLKDAVADGDRIYAVIKGSAINNDGSAKVGFTAPSVGGQAKVIAEAQAIAKIPPETISYIEAHGTGTALGDPIEISALKKVFEAKTKKQGFCAIGSVKTNVGHLNSASGVTGLIKTVLALKNKQIPASLHFEKANPEIDFDNSPFYVNTKLSSWKRNGTPRRAGVSSFGFGGTNAHVVLEEAPPTTEASSPSRPYQLLLLSGKTPTALENITTNLLTHLKQDNQQNFPDIAYTLAVGRRGFEQRSILVCQNQSDAINQLEENLLITSESKTTHRRVVFMFPGQGSQYVNMGRQLYETETTFALAFDNCAEILKPHVGIDIRNLIYPTQETAQAAEQLQQTAIAQTTIFAVEYSLACLLMEWGIKPTAMIGHSIGEYVAATIAGVFSLEDALMLVAKRGQLMQEMPTGGMLAVPLPFEEIEPLLAEGLSVAAINTPSSCVISGTCEQIKSLQAQLANKQVDTRLLHTSHGFHSRLMEPMLESFVKQLSQINLQPPQIPYISNLTGTWITPQEATSPQYWADHLRHTVRFAQGIETLNQSGQIFLEVGAGWTLSKLVKQNFNSLSDSVTAINPIVNTLAHPKEKQKTLEQFYTNLGKLWLYGADIDFTGFYQHEKRHRLPLPTYPFERQRYWIEAAKKKQLSQGTVEKRTTKVEVLEDQKLDIKQWFYQASWQPSLLETSPQTQTAQKSSTLIFLDESTLAQQLVKQFDRNNLELFTTVKIGSQFERLGDNEFTLNPQQPEEYHSLIEHLYGQEQQPTKIVHLWSITPEKEYSHPTLAGVDDSQDKGFYSLIYLAQALGKQKQSRDVELIVISNNLHSITGVEQLSPEKATILGAVKVIPQEYPNIRCRSIDVVLAQQETWQAKKLLEQLHIELQTPQIDELIAYRGHQRWIQKIQPVGLQQTEQPKLRQKGVYLITGGLGGIGLSLAKYLAQTVQAKLVLVTRKPFPEKAEWSQYLSKNGDKDPISAKIIKLQELEEYSAQVLVLNGDASNLEQMRGVVSTAREQFGEINGVIHSAGVPGGGIIQRKTLAEVKSVLAPKLQGTLVLNSLFEDIQLDFFVLCSSLASILGQFGQVDYTAANVFLDAFANYKAVTDGSKTVAINWDAWQEVGMAVAALENKQNKTSVKQQEVEPVSHPLFDQCLIENDGEWVYISNLSISSDWVVDSHRVMGKATLPGTAYLEMAIAAARHRFGEESIILSDVTFLAPLTVEEDEKKQVRTLIKLEGDKFEFSIMTQSQEERWVVHARGYIQTDTPQQAIKHDIHGLENICNQQQTAPTKKSSFLELGARWNNLKQVKLGTNQGLALLELPTEFIDEIKQYQLHPALLDIATGFLSSRYQQQQLYLPFSYKKLQFKAPLVGKLYSHVQLRQEEDLQTPILSFDITIMDEEGTELVVIEEYTLRKIHNPNAETDSSTPPKQQELEHIENINVRISNPGVLETIAPHISSRQKPGKKQVEIEVMATALNFKEVLMALGLMPMPADFGFGLECAGKVVAVGSEVEDFAVGDEVMAFSRSSMSKFVTTDASLVVPKPKNLSFEEAATIPVAFVTAYIALIHFGRLRKGEKVLIHAAAGGVGLAAVQIAQWLGCEIFATAGSPEKREFLQSLGIKYVMDSRSLDFASEVMEYTQGQGVDAVLNSLGGEFIPKGLSVLATYGRFLELGMRDVLNNSQLGLKVFEKRLSFFVIQAEPQLPDFSMLWREVAQHCDRQDFKPLPYRVFGIKELPLAFEHMAKAKHIGKVVISLPTLEELRKYSYQVTKTNQQNKKNLAGSIPKKKSSPTDSQQDFLKQGLLPKEGIKIFQQVLESQFSQVIVSTRGLLNQVENSGNGNLSTSPEATVNNHSSQDINSKHPRPKLDNQYVAPDNEIEQKIAQIWQDLLGIKKIGRHDNFFELGGDSLLIVQVRSKLLTILNKDISIASAFEYPTISSLAKYLGQEQVEAPKFEQVNERAKKKELAMAEKRQRMKQKRR
ncbi:putative beta-ketoacyl synthase [Calothrix parasitica NIES-267]|uniref:Phenolphthiocerol/phthiocerol polyketide synthase subunit E n=1 Tax=Calothrix parasitica NIES-267 TaxID=1973488 RepID=A0A1Z4LT37_9CYAN|nr:putative beta-ketoacyl synthase [Calothrix parasitica NIES-267]